MSSSPCFTPAVQWDRLQYFMMPNLKVFFFFLLLYSLLVSSALASPSPFPCSLCTHSASKATRGSGWVATSFSFPLMLSSHSAVACSVRAERTPGSPPEASARRSPPLPAHLREPSEWSAIVLAVIWWPHSTGRQSQGPGGSPLLTGCDEALPFFLLFLSNMSIVQDGSFANSDRCIKALHIFWAFKVKIYPSRPHRPVENSY